MDWVDYREKLGIGFCDEEKFKYFKVKIFNILNDVSKETYSGCIYTDEYSTFCNMVGIPFNFDYVNDCYRHERFEHCLSIIERTTSISEFLAYYVGLTNSIRVTKHSERELTRKHFSRIVCEMLTESHIPFDLLEDEGEYFVFPKGAVELDKALVSEPLEWLKDYPATRKTYIIALKQYSDGIYIRDVADNLRKALESFLQEFLKNTKNLETNKAEICKYLGGQGVDAGISGLFQPLINTYKNVNDKIAKHNDAVDAKLLEFLLYQTGILIRMVLSVQAQETEVLYHAD